MRGGMRSGWAASRTGQLSDTASQLTFGVCQGGHRPRWTRTVPQTISIEATIGDGRPTWKHRATNKPSRTERATGFRVPSGDLGTHAMHLPTRAVTRFLRDRHHHNIQPVRFPVRAGTAARPYAEDLFHKMSHGIHNQYWYLIRLAQPEPASQRDARWNEEWVGR